MLGSRASDGPHTSGKPPVSSLAFFVLLAGFCNWEFLHEKQNDLERQVCAIHRAPDV